MLFRPIANLELADDVKFVSGLRETDRPAALFIKVKHSIRVLDAAFAQIVPVLFINDIAGIPVHADPFAAVVVLPVGAVELAVDFHGAVMMRIQNFAGPYDLDAFAVGI